MRKIIALAGVACLALAASAANASTTTTIWFVPGSVDLRAGPDETFPVVATIPPNAHMDLEGCLSGYTWCDVSWNDERGWVSGRNIEAINQNKTVDLTDLAPEVKVPVVTYNTASYWDTYYKTTPFYVKREKYITWEPAPAASSATTTP